MYALAAGPHCAGKLTRWVLNFRSLLQRRNAANCQLNSSHWGIIFFFFWGGERKYVVFIWISCPCGSFCERLMELVGNQAHMLMLDCEKILKLLLLNDRYWQKVKRPDWFEWFGYSEDQRFIRNWRFYPHSCQLLSDVSRGRLSYYWSVQQM